MRVIVSHDVDHLRSREHWRDGVLAKAAIRAVVECAHGRIPPREVLQRWGAFAGGRLEHIRELAEFDLSHGVRPTFFFGMERGLGLSYPWQDTSPHIRWLQDAGIPVGPHGMAYDDPVAMGQERDRFRKLSGQKEFGIRMHYLRQGPRTLDHLGSLGYRFDSTGPEDRGPWRHRSGMWVFPLHLMDGWYLMGGQRWQSRSAGEALALAIRRIEGLVDSGVDYITINFHDNYFCPGFAAWRDWYQLLITHLRGQGAEFIDYQEAIRRLDAVP